MNRTLIDALNGRTQDHVPVWFMRQAGRHMPEFSKYMAESNLSKIIKSPEKSSKIALEPVEKLNVDAAIMFADIVTPLEAAGLEYSYEVGNGPMIKGYIKPEEFKIKVQSMEGDELWFIKEQIKEIRHLTDVPVIGFTGAPFTLATYVIEGRYVRESPGTKSFMIRNNWNDFLNDLAELIVKYIDVQVKAGASVIQLFDTWVGTLSAEQFTNYYLNALSTLVSRIKGQVPVIYFCTDCSHLMAKIVQKVKPTAISVDWKTSLRSFYRTKEIGVQGNLDPVYALVGKRTMLAEADRVLDDARGLNKYVFNLGHGVLPGTEWKELKKLVEHIHGQKTL